MLDLRWVWWALGFASALYVLTVATVLVNSFLQARRERRHAHFERLFIVNGSGGSETGTVLQRELEREPLRTLRYLVMEPSVSLPLRIAVSQALLSRLGLPRIIRNSEGRPGGRDSRQRVVALRILADTRPETALQQLESALATGGRTVLGSAVTILGQIRDRRAATLLAGALIDGRGPRSRIATVLEAFPFDVPDLVSPLLWSETPAARYWGAMLARRYARHDGLGTHLVMLAGDPDPLARRAAIESLAVVGGPEAAAAVWRRLNDPVPYVRAHAIRTLAALEGRDAAAAILPALADRDWWVRFAVKQSLETIGPAVAPDVVPFLSHRDAFARDGAAEVLQNIGAFERWLAQDAREWRDSASLDGLKFLASAAGTPIWRSVLGRLDIDARRRARQVRADIGRMEH